MIYLATDHAGYELKEAIKKHLDTMNLSYEDVGALEYIETDDYPDFILPAAEKVATDPGVNRGIIFGGSGQGEALAANKVPGIRAALYYGGNKDIVKLSRTHNNANILSLGARFVSEAEAKEVVTLWLETEFAGDERHVRRLDKVTAYENR
jgi:ribose 5-phosphate isomerase B